MGKPLGSSHILWNTQCKSVGAEYSTWPSRDIRWGMRGSQPGNQLWNLLCMNLKALNHSCYVPKLICPWCIAMQCDNKIIQCTCSADVTVDWVDDNLHKSSRSFDDGLQVNNQLRTNTTINKEIWIVFKLVSWYELNSHWYLKVCIS